MSLRRLAWWVLVVVLVAATAGAGYFGVAQMNSKDRPPAVVDGAAQRESVQKTTSTDLQKLLSYDFQTIEQTLNAAASQLTPKFRSTFLDKANKEIIPQARQRKMTSQVNIVGVGVTDLDDARASVIAFVNSTYSSPDSQPVYSGSRLRVALAKHGDSWLIDQIDVI
jgi:Mce-associated membrane protein